MIKRLDKLGSKALKERFYTKLQKITLSNKSRSVWIPCYWYPLIRVKDDIPVLAFYFDFFNDKKRINILKDIFYRHKVKTVTVIQELDEACISDDFFSDFFSCDEDGYELSYFSEQFIYDDAKDWLIYTSHEGTITFAGLWLTEEIAQKVLDFHDGLWL